VSLAGAHITCGLCWTESLLQSFLPPRGHHAAYRPQDASFKGFGEPVIEKVCRN
jgi:hypothetical protein